MVSILDIEKICKEALIDIHEVDEDEIRVYAEEAFLYILEIVKECKESLYKY